MAALTAPDLLAAKGALVPLMVPVLRMYRAQGIADPVATMKSRYQDNTQAGAGTVYQFLMRDLGFGVTNAVTLDPGDFNECVNMAALRL